MGARRDAARADAPLALSPRRNCRAGARAGERVGGRNKGTKEKARARERERKREGSTHIRVTAFRSCACFPSGSGRRWARELFRLKGDVAFCVAAIARGGDLARGRLLEAGAIPTLERIWSGQARPQSRYSARPSHDTRHVPVTIFSTSQSRCSARPQSRYSAPPQSRVGTCWVSDTRHGLVCSVRPWSYSIDSNIAVIASPLSLSLSLSLYLFFLFLAFTLFLPPSLPPSLFQ